MFVCRRRELLDGCGLCVRGLRVTINAHKKDLDLYTKSVIIAMRHMKWEDLEDDAHVELGDGRTVPLVRLVRLCEYLDSPSNRDGMRQDLQRTGSRVSLWLAVHAPKLMDSDGRCRRCFACSNVLKLPVGLAENWIDDASLASPYWLIDNIGAWQQPSLEAARKMMRSQERVGQSTVSRLPKEGLSDEIASLIKASVAVVQYRLYIRTDDGSFEPVSNETLE